SNVAPNDAVATLNVVSTVTVVPVNDEPTLSATGSDPTFTENGAAQLLYTGAVASTVEALQTFTGLTLTVASVADGAAEVLSLDGSTVALTDGNGGTTATNGLTFAVTVGGGTATVTLTGGGLSAGALQTLVNGLGYQNTSEDPTAGTRTVTLTSVTDSGSNVAPNDAVATLNLVSTVTVDAVNDAPVLSGLGDDTPGYAVGSGTPVRLDENLNAAVSDIELGNDADFAGATLTVRRDGASAVTVDGVADTDDEFDFDTAGALFTVNGTALEAGGQAFATFDVTTTPGALVVTFDSAATTATQALVNDVLRRVTYQNDNAADAGQNRLEYVFDDGNAGAQGTGGAQSTTTTLSVGVSTRPEVDLDGGGAPIDFTAADFVEPGTATAGTPVALVDVANLTVTDPDGDQIQSAVVQFTGGFADVGSELLSVTASGAIVAGDISYNAGTGVLTITKLASQSDYQAVLRTLTYQNVSQDPTGGARTLSVTVTDANGVDNLPLPVATITVVPGNDEPTLTATGVNPGFVENGVAQVLYAGAVANTVEAAQTFTGLTLTVTNVVDGPAERLNIDGSAVTLTDGNGGTTATNGLTFAVTVGGGTATVTLTKGAGVSVAALQTVVNTLSYQHTSDDPTAGGRTVTLTSVTDSGANGGNDDNVASLALTSTVNVIAVNDEPTFSATGSNPTFTEDGGVAVLYTGASANTIEATQTFTGLTLTVTNVVNGASEVLNADGTGIALTNGNGGTTAGNGLTIAVTLSGSTATLTLSGGNLSAAALQTLVNGLSYQNTSQDPTGGSRVVTLTSVTDSGLNIAPNDAVATLNVVSTVTVVPVNDEPTLSATGSNPTFTENGSSQLLYTGAAASTVEATQTFTGLTLTVSNVANGTSEKLTVNGVDVDLVA
ncbi:MAG: beta strand repeat-containing protein, partial [Dongiaceae bacterium]